MPSSESDDRAATALLMAMATARNSGHVTTYVQLLGEATTEPARSLVLIDTLVRLFPESGKGASNGRAHVERGLPPNSCARHRSKRWHCIVNRQGGWRRTRSGRESPTWPC